MNYSCSVFCTLEFSAIHCWPSAPYPVCFLAHPHRHLFKVTCHAPVQHNDRDIEFITLKERIHDFCVRNYEGKDIGTTSCEMIALAILEAFPELNEVTVSEDGENGATIGSRNENHR